MLPSVYLKKILVPAAFSAGGSQARTAAGLAGTSRPWGELVPGFWLRLCSAAPKPQLQLVGAKVNFASLFCVVLPIEEYLVPRIAAPSLSCGGDAPGVELQRGDGAFPSSFVQLPAR